MLLKYVEAHLLKSHPVQGTESGLVVFARGQLKVAVHVKYRAAPPSVLELGLEREGGGGLAAAGLAAYREHVAPALRDRQHFAQS
jgi:hypothetical protein